MKQCFVGTNTLLCVLVLSLCETVSGGREQYFVKQPEDVTVVAGEKAILTCIVDFKEGSLQWTKDGFGLGTNRSLPGYPKYTMVGSDPVRDWNLEILSTDIEDDAVYQCQVGAGGNSKPIRSQKARLTVLVPPGAPVITQGNMVGVTAGQETVLECVSHGGSSAVQLTWQDETGSLIGTDINTSSNREGKTFTTVSTLRLMTTTSDDHRKIYCIVSSHLSREKQHTWTELRVTYKPQIKINIQGGGLPSEGDSLTAICETDAQPAVTSISWYIDQMLIETGGQIVIEKLDKKYQGSVLKCKADNSVGSSEASINLDVKYGPIITLQPQSMTARLEQEVTFHCQAAGNPPPVYVWTKVGDMLPVSYSQNLTVTTSSETVGEYQCEARVVTVVKSQTVSLSLLTKPVIRGDKVQYGMMGQSVRLNCPFDGTVDSSTVMTWDQAGNIISSHDDLYQMSSNQLIIKMAIEKDFNTFYGCRVVNEIGEDYLPITLLQQEVNVVLSTNMVLYVVIAVFGVLILGLVLVLCGVLYQRRNKSNLKYLTGSQNRKSPGRKESPDDSPELQRLSCAEPDLIPVPRIGWDPRESSNEPSEDGHSYFGNVIYPSESDYTKQSDQWKPLRFPSRYLEMEREEPNTVQYPLQNSYIADVTTDKSTPTQYKNLGSEDICSSNPLIASHHSFHKSPVQSMAAPLANIYSYDDQ